MKYAVEFLTVVTSKVIVDEKELPDKHSGNVKEDYAKVAADKWLRYESEEAYIPELIERERDNILGLVDVYRIKE